MDHHLEVHSDSEWVEGGSLELGLFDEKNLFELDHPDYPGERLVVCRNPELAKSREHKRQKLLDATKEKLEEAQATVARKKENVGEIGIRVGKVVGRYKMAKHFVIDIVEGRFTFRINEEKIHAEAQLDGLYVVRTRVAKDRMSAKDAVRNYKNLCRVERAFRTFKSVDLQVRLIYHVTENRVRAHIFLCMFSYYVEWHLRDAWIFPI